MNDHFKTVKFNYGSKNQNPIENVRCFNKYSTDKAFKIEKNQVKISIEKNGIYSNNN
jgi:hypothetical protein